MQVGILEGNLFSKDVLGFLRERYDVEVFDLNNLEYFLRNKEVLFIRLGYQINQDFLSKARKLKIICTPTTGLNHIDMSACKDRDIKILSLKNEQDFLSTVRATPEHTLGLILSLLRNYAHAFNISKLEECNREIYRGGELYGNRVGIIGFGRVGKILSRYLQAIGAKRVFYFDIDDSITSDGFSIKSNSIYELINASNIIILSASFSEGYREFIGKHVIDSMKEKFFINTSRGELVDEEYLIEKIKKHHFNGVAVDVVSNDSEVCNYIKYMTIPEEINFIFTPHIAGITHESMHKTEMFIYKKLVNFLDNS